MVVSLHQPSGSDTKLRGALPAVLGRLTQEESCTRNLHAGHPSQAPQFRSTESTLYQSTAVGVSATASITDMTGPRVCVITTVSFPRYARLQQTTMMLVLAAVSGSRFQSPYCRTMLKPL